MGAGAPAERVNLLAVEDVARNMIRQAQEKVGEITRKAGELEETYRLRREELADEMRIRREVQEEELRDLRARTEAELDALGKEVKEAAYKEAREEGYQAGLLAGRRDGLEEGLEAGRAQGREETAARLGDELSGAIACVNKVAADIDARRASLLRDAEREVLALAIAVAEKIVKREIRCCPDVIVNNVRKALETIAQRSGATIEVNPDDLALVEAHAREALDIFRESPGLRLAANSHVARGGCMVTSAGGGADLRIDTQLDLIEQVLLGEERARVSAGTRTAQ